MVARVSTRDLYPLTGIAHEQINRDLILLMCVSFHRRVAGSLLLPVADKVSSLVVRFRGGVFFRVTVMLL